MDEITNSPLGKQADYVCHYAPSLLFPIPRQLKRDEIGVGARLPFYGMDVWQGYELSWLNQDGKPIVAYMKCTIDCDSTNLIESKSFKLYLNSFNQTVFSSLEEVRSILTQDLTLAALGKVSLEVSLLSDLEDEYLSGLPGFLLDELSVVCDTYVCCPDYLSSNADKPVKERLASHLLKSNCLVTGQPDWGSVLISYEGPQIDKEGLLKYIVSFRNHHEFHEQCVERIFMDIMTYCHPDVLTVEAFYTRRGGLDINPIRSTERKVPFRDIRLVRQ
jgi:7-cyano-7-deazaguanine reductase